jgi:hypothetical protein
MCCQYVLGQRGYAPLVSSNAANVLAAAGMLRECKCLIAHTLDHGCRRTFAALKRWNRQGGTARDLKESSAAHNMGTGRGTVRLYVRREHHFRNSRARESANSSITTTHTPDSERMTLISFAMYWTGVPLGGVG